MTSTLCSLFFSIDKVFITLNTNILETNVINILILIGLLLYANKISFSSILNERKVEIMRTLENAEKDTTVALNYYLLAENDFMLGILFLELLKMESNIEKEYIANIKLKKIKENVSKAFFVTKGLALKFKVKALYQLKRYILLAFTSKIIRKFHFLEEKDRKRLLNLVIYNLR